MMPKDSPMSEEVNNIISAMKSDGTLPAIYEKWLGVAPPPNGSDRNSTADPDFGYRVSAATQGVLCEDMARPQREGAGG